MNRFGWLASGALGAGALVAVVGFPMAMSAATLFAVTDLKEGITPVSCGNTATIRQVARDTPKVQGFTAVQVRNATTIVQAGQDKKVPPRGWVIAVATAMQESDLRNLASNSRRWPTVARLSQALPHEGDGNDHDSVGLFQQRADEGEAAEQGRKAWGPVKDLMTPSVSAKKFYAALLKVDGWQTMALTKAAQRVQGSAYPSAYAKHEDKAARLVDAVSGNAAQTPAAAEQVGACAANTDKVASTGWVRPVSARIGDRYHAAARVGHKHEGVDLIAKRGKPIVSVAAGTVIHMECDRQREDGYNCNRDGSPRTRGCGWYLDIRHAGNIITRYCHQLRKPLVGVGDKVKAGQQIGVVGTSGSSSGPHLHFEVHRGCRTSSCTTDPEKFMKDHGAPLGTSDKGGEVVA